MKTNNANKQTVNKTGRLVYPQTSYQLMGILFKVHNRLGWSYKEKYYQRVIEKELDNQRVAYRREVRVDLKYGDQKIGYYFLDFIIDGKLVLETKVVPRINLSHIKQALAYLDSANLKLAIVANFRPRQLTYRRIINPKIKKW